MLRIKVMLLVGLLLGLNASVFAQSKNPELLFFQHADNGELRLDKRTGCYRMHLTGIGKQVIYLSGAPDEMTGQLSIPVFISSWQHQKATQIVKPNAILHAKVVTADQRITQASDVFVIKDISYRGRDNSMIYDICRFKREAAFKVGKLQDVNVFVDPFHRWPP